MTEPNPCPVCGQKPLGLTPFDSVWEKLTEEYEAGYLLMCSNKKCTFTQHTESYHYLDSAITEWNYICRHYRASTPVVHEEFVSFLGGK